MNPAADDGDPVLYESTPQNITQHFRAIYADGEVLEAVTCKPYLHVRAEGRRSVGSRQTRGAHESA